MNAKEKVNELYAEKRRQHNNDYYQRNREKILQKRHEDYLSDPEKYKERNHYNYQKRKARGNDCID